MTLLADLPLRGTVTDSASFAGASLSGGGRFTATALRDYIASAIGTTLGLSSAAPAALGAAAQAGTATTAARADHVHAVPTAAAIGAAPSGHTHAQSDVSGLSSALAGKAALDHQHSITGVVNLTEALAAKQETSAKGAVNGYASLGSDARLPLAQLPSTAVTTSYLAPIDALSANYTALQADNNRVKYATSGSAVVVTLPSLSIGTTLRVIQGGAGKVTFSPGSGASLLSLGALASTAGQNASVTATVVATGQWNLSGSLGA